MSVWQRLLQHPQNAPLVHVDRSASNIGNPWSNAHDRMEQEARASNIRTANANNNAAVERMRAAIRILQEKVNKNARIENAKNDATIKETRDRIENLKDTVDENARTSNAKNDATIQETRDRIENLKDTVDALKALTTDIKDNSAKFQPGYREITNLKNELKNELDKMSRDARQQASFVTKNTDDVKEVQKKLQAFEKTAPITIRQDVIDELTEELEGLKKQLITELENAVDKQRDDNDKRFTGLENDLEFHGNQLEILNEKKEADEAKAAAEAAAREAARKEAARRSAGAPRPGAATKGGALP